jgi:sec-independent protein translocase protein TatA
MLLFLSDVSGSEVLLILIFVLIFFGAKSIPSLAKTLGKAMYQIKNASNELQNEIKKSGLDIKNDMNFTNVFKETTDSITNPIANELNEMKDTIYTPTGVRAFGSEIPEITKEASPNDLDQTKDSSEQTIASKEKMPSTEEDSTRE